LLNEFGFHVKNYKYEGNQTHLYIQQHKKHEQCGTPIQFQ